jgi:hypothetical protein
MFWGFSSVSRRFEHQADWFATRHMAASLAAEPERLTPLSLEEYLGRQRPQWVGAELALPTDAPPQPTGGQAAAGQAPGTFAGTDVSGPRSAADAGPGAVAAGVVAAPSATALHLGADLFGSALQQIITLSHRSMERGGWLHPSGRRRLALLHDLAARPDRQRAFARQMRRTRLLIVGLFLVGVALAGLANYHDLVALLPAR